MANQLLTSQMITRETLRIIVNNLKVASNLNNGYDEKFGQQGNKIGDTLFVRKPQRYTVRNGQAFQPQALSDQQTPVVLNNQSGVDFQFTSQELKLSIDDFRKRYLNTAAAALANYVDFGCAQTMYQQTWNFAGTPGTTPSTAAAVLSAGRILDDSAAPRDNNRCLVINPGANASIVDALKGLFQSSEKISEQYKSGMMGRALGFDWYMDQNINTHVTGAFGGVPVVAGANQVGTGGDNGSQTINTSGWTASTQVLNAGDIISFAGCNQVNPQNRVSVGYAKPFVVLSDVISDAGGLATIAIRSAITPDTQYQNVDAAPANNAAISIWGVLNGTGLNAKQSPQNLAFHRDSFTFLSVPLDKPDGVDMAYTERDSDTGVSLRFIRQYVATADMWVSRFDILWGVSPLYPEWCCRLAG